jgi:hypothetical protein
MRQSRSGLAVLGVFVGLLLAAMVGLLLWVSADWQGDALPRPLAVAILYGAPSIVGLVGVMSRRRWPLVGAGAALFLGALISVGTFVFFLPALLMIGGGFTIGETTDEQAARRLAVGQAAASGGLLLLAGWAALFGLTSNGCVDLNGGQLCSENFITPTGVLVAAACLVAAVAVAVWSAGGLPRPGRWRS